MQKAQTHSWAYLSGSTFAQYVCEFVRMCVGQYVILCIHYPLTRRQLLHSYVVYIMHFKRLIIQMQSSSDERKITSSIFTMCQLQWLGFIVCFREFFYVMLSCVFVCMRYNGMCVWCDWCNSTRNLLLIVILKNVLHMSTSRANVLAEMFFSSFRLFVRLFYSILILLAEI